MIKLKWVLIQTTNILNIYWCYAFESWKSCLFISVCPPKGTCYMYAKIIAQCFTRLDVSTMDPLRVKTHWVEPLC